ncbi:hypothetical protein P2H44_10820 [Albimonas sp. CAU 1670]|uniref:hypothetical protein n=1 Tax=Albimonas sp. CAU 1670 TaxID=3032599 RepID=UPI0023DCBA95|nr:hypothetical protein [Albimonas sp. CAU 1670]MDF2233044.1 hypothetical protein [Albimonas sp. CAU 1670]
MSSIVLRPLSRSGDPFGLRAALFAALATAALAAALLFAAPVRADDSPVRDLQGRYVGIGPARGMQVEITDVGRKPAGKFHDSNGVEADIGGGWKEGGLEALLNFPGRPVFVRMTPSALGMQMAVLPLDPEGKPLREQARVLAFLREGIETPEQPALYQDPPKRAGSEIDPDVFLASYQFWPPEGVANGFDNIGPRYRTILRMFPQIHADVLWKLCQAQTQRGLLAEALRGQGAGCADIEKTVARLQSAGRFSDWKAAVDREIGQLMPAVQCSRGYIVKESVCGPASQRVAKAATSLETLGTLLAQWR